MSDIFNTIRALVGAAPDEDISVVLPQFTRPSGDRPQITPRNVDDVRALLAAPKWVRDQCCVGNWSSGAGWEHRLIPHEWFDAVAVGSVWLDINERVGPWSGESKDMRYGALPIGLLFGDAEAWRAELITYLQSCPGRMARKYYPGEPDTYFERRIEELRALDLSGVTLPR